MASSLTRSREANRSLALLIIPPLQVTPDHDHVALEAAMQSLVLDKKHPVALELAGTAERRCFIVRSTTLSALDHVESLLRSQYPQLEVRPLRDFEDPFRLELHETVSAVELFPGGQSYLPLRNWEDNKQEHDEIDPIFALLAALSKLPEKVRVVTQIALVPAVTNWSKKDLRKTVEDSLNEERRAQMQDMLVGRMYKEAYSTQVVICAGLLVVFFMLIRPWIPGWMGSAFVHFLFGQDPHLSNIQVFQLIALAVGMVVFGVVVYLILQWIYQLMHPTPIYDPRLVAQRTSRMAYHTRIRLYVIGPRMQETLVSEDTAQPEVPGLWDQLRFEREQAEMREDLLLRLTAAYRQFNVSSGAYFIPKPIPWRKAYVMVAQNSGEPGWTKGVAKSHHLVTVDSLASLWHLPDAASLPELALVEHRRSRTMLMPPDVARQAAGLRPIGYSEHGGYRLPFALSPQFFTTHTLIAGKSGEGKSTCMEHIAREAMMQGGLILIDPHGDLCDHVLNVVPASRLEDVVLIDLSDSTASVGINPLDVTLGRGRDKVISDLMKTLAHIWTTSWGPRMENAFEMSLRTLFEANRFLVAADPQNGPSQQYTLLEVLPLLTNENFCHAILAQIDDDYLHRWWREYYAPLTLMQQRDIINPVITKVAKFESVIARRIIGQSVATLNFTEMIAERKIILLKLAKGIIGADVAALLGACILGLLQITLEEQGSKAEANRARFPIILDEFQTFAGVDYGALAELRKYGATFFLATQSLEYLQRLDEFLLPTVLANVRQLMMFNLSARDAEKLYPELGVEQDDILNLDMHTCYVKLSVGNRRQSTFSLHIEPPLPGDAVLAEQIRARCRVRYTRSAGEVDTMLRDAMIRSVRLAPAPKGRHKSPPSGPNMRPRGNSAPNTSTPMPQPGGPLSNAPIPMPQPAAHMKNTSIPMSQVGGPVTGGPAPVPQPAAHVRNVPPISQPGGGPLPNGSAPMPPAGGPVTGVPAPMSQPATYTKNAPTSIPVSGMPAANVPERVPPLSAFPVMPVPDEQMASEDDIAVGGEKKRRRRGKRGRGSRGRAAKPNDMSQTNSYSVENDDDDQGEDEQEFLDVRSLYPSKEEDGYQY